MSHFGRYRVGDEHAHDGKLGVRCTENGAMASATEEVSIAQERNARSLPIMGSGRA